MGAIPYRPAYQSGWWQNRWFHRDHGGLDIRGCTNQRRRFQPHASGAGPSRGCSGSSRCMDLGDPKLPKGWVPSWWWCFCGAPHLASLEVWARRRGPLSTWLKWSAPQVHFLGRRPRDPRGHPWGWVQKPFFIPHSSFRHDFYWPTDLRDATKLVQKCKVCQFHAKQIHTPAQLVQLIPLSWPFTVWGLIFSVHSQRPLAATSTSTLLSTNSPSGLKLLPLGTSTRILLFPCTRCRTVCS